MVRHIVVVFGASRAGLVVLTVWLYMGRAGLECAGHTDLLVLPLASVLLSMSTMATLRLTLRA